jgi:arginase
MPTATPLDNDVRPAGPVARRLGLIGAPSDVAAGARGANLGPAALRVAGLGNALARMGYAVHDHGNLAGPPNPMQAAVDGHRHLRETVDWCRRVRDAISASLEQAETPVLLGGDHALSIGSIAAVARHCDDHDRPLWVLWLDAHADFNTHETSPSGNIHGMAVAVLCGHGHSALLELGHAIPLLEPAHVHQLGIRSVDAIEQRKVHERGLAIHDMRRIDERGMGAVMRETLEAIARIGGHLHVSLDLDFVDPGIAPGVGTPVPGGPTYREAQLCMEMIHNSGLLGSLDIVEVNPALDTHNRTAELAVQLVESLFGERIVARVV